MCEAPAAPPAGMEAIDGAGVEGATADPERPGTILDLCGDVSVVVWLLGSAAGDSESVSAIHGPRLERLMEKLVESPVRGFAYEAVGTTEESFLREGRGIVERAGERWRIPTAVLTRPRDETGWAEQTGDQVAQLLTG